MPVASVGDPSPSSSATSSIPPPAPTAVAKVVPAKKPTLQLKDIPVDTSFGQLVAVAWVVGWSGEGCEFSGVRAGVSLRKTGAQWFGGDCGLRLRYQRGVWAGTWENARCGPMHIQAMGLGSAGTAWSYAKQYNRAANYGQSCTQPSGWHDFVGGHWRPSPEPFVLHDRAVAGKTDAWLLGNGSPYVDQRPSESYTTLRYVTRGRVQEVESPPLDMIFDYSASPNGDVWFVGQNTVDNGAVQKVVRSAVAGPKLAKSVPAPPNGKWIESTLSTKVLKNQAGPLIVAAADGSAWVLAGERLWVASGATLTEVALPALAEFKVVNVVAATSATDALLYAKVGEHKAVLHVKDKRVLRVPLAEGANEGMFMQSYVQGASFGDDLWAYSERTIWKQVRPNEQPPKTFYLSFGDGKNVTVKPTNGKRFTF